MHYYKDRNKLMKCPNCKKELQVFEFKNLKTHECLSCKGMWINHGIIKENTDFWALLNILKIKIAIQHPRLEQAWEEIESISPIK